MKRKIIIIEEYDDEKPFFPIRINPNPILDGYICQKCGRRVGSMEYHPCNQPWCGPVLDGSNWS